MRWPLDRDELSLKGGQSVDLLVNPLRQCFAVEVYRANNNPSMLMMALVEANKVATIQRQNRSLQSHGTIEEYGVRCSLIGQPIIHDRHNIMAKASEVLNSLSREVFVAVEAVRQGGSVEN